MMRDKTYTEIVWVFGNSAVGKQTFMDECKVGNLIVEKLGWKGRSIYVSPTSVDVIGGSTQVNLREKIIEECDEATKEYDIILIKWQYEDSETGRIARLKDGLTQVEQSILWLVAPDYETQRERLLSKSWWHDGEIRQKEFITDENEDVSTMVRAAEQVLGAKARKIISMNERRYELA